MLAASDLQLDYSLTDDFCRNHFMVGLLLREVGGALQECREIRQIAIQVLKGLMIKHTFDDRYVAKVSLMAAFILEITLLGFFFFTNVCGIIAEPTGQTCYPLPPTLWPASGKRLQTSHQGLYSAKPQCKTDV